MRIIYNDGGINADVVGLLQYINEFTKELGLVDVQVDDVACTSVLNGMKLDFPHVDGIEQASVFKKLGNFLTYFIAEAPIKSSFPVEKIGENLAKIRNHQNAIVGLHLVLDSLHNASICSGDTEKIIQNRVKISQHSYVDIINAINTVTPRDHYHLVTVLLEQMVYKDNPELQYELITF